jgi:hypothetical protein
MLLARQVHVASVSLSRECTAISRRELFSRFLHGLRECCDLRGKPTRSALVLSHVEIGHVKCHVWQRSLNLELFRTGTCALFPFTFIHRIISADPETSQSDVKLFGSVALNGKTLAR